ncbi:DnaD domain-containing protein [Apilactobacillus timberlakei]|uniref:DnaD domain-containing protein n=1 Tax=Apilactobacillus timberlakei TaxID=2008380 RepID=UPI00112B810E|nr:DnaD domain protein [Apilactobacillus timberlakei]TPR16670.1 DnaD domain protein [Apilactobacillus timberlakei]
MTKVYKDRESNFTHVKNDIFDTDKYEVNTLSWKAMGIFTYMWHLPDNWEFYEDELASHAKDGKDGLRSGIKELEQAGFLKRDWHRRSGKFASYDWILNESPFLDFPKTVKPKTVLPKSDNPKLQSTKGTKYLSNKVSSSGDDFKNQSEEKGSKENTTSNAFKMYERLWGFPNAIAIQDLKQWINDYSDELVTCAITIAGRNNVSPRGAYSYLDKILTEWSKSGIETVEDAKKQNKEHSQRLDREFKQRKSYGGHTPIKEEPPEWLKKYEDNNYKKEHSNSKNNQHSSKRTKELEDKLKRIRSGELQHD